MVFSGESSALTTLISVLECPILQTMQPDLTLSNNSLVTTLLLPVAVMMMSTDFITSGSVTTRNPSILRKKRLLHVPKPRPRLDLPSLKSADRVYFCHINNGTHTFERGAATFTNLWAKFIGEFRSHFATSSRTYFTVATDDDLFATEHAISSSFQTSKKWKTVWEYFNRMICIEMPNCFTLDL